jgi:hypothetical protein
MPPSVHTDLRVLENNEPAAAIFSIIASCHPHRLDPFTCLEEMWRVLLYWRWK